MLNLRTVTCGCSHVPFFFFSEGAYVSSSFEGVLLQPMFKLMVKVGGLFTLPETLSLQGNYHFDDLTTYIPSFEPAGNGELLEIYNILGKMHPFFRG